MGRERVLIFWSSGGLAGGLLAASVFAQPPSAVTTALPPLPPGFGPPPVIASGPYAAGPGPGRRTNRHVWNVFQDNFVGYPQEFVEPPPGFYLQDNLSRMKAKAATHRFTLYRSDFLPGTDRLSPAGAGRFNLIAPRLGRWQGPLVIEWSPEEPGLAQARRAAIVALLGGVGVPVPPERVVVGPSPYPGALGTDAANTYTNVIVRDQAAGAGYSLSPTAGGSFGGQGGGGP